MIGGILSTLFCIIGSLIACYYSILPNPQHRTAVPTLPTVPRPPIVPSTAALPTIPEEKDSLLTPPPPYTPPFHGVGEDGNPLRLSTNHMEGEEQNTSLFPPPPPYSSL